MSANKNQRVLRDAAAQRGIRRKDHFVAGGSPAEWRGLHTVTPDKKKQKSRNSCRKYRFRGG